MLFWQAISIRNFRTFTVMCSIMLLHGSVVVDSLFNVAPIVNGGSAFGPCFVMQYLVSFLVLQSF